MIVIGINFLIGIVGGLYFNIDQYSNEVVKNQLTFYDTYEGQYQDEDIIYSGVKNKETLTDPSIGSSLNWGKVILDIFLYGINPFSINSSQFETYVEQIFADMLSMFRSFMWIILAIEIYMVIKNKKSS